MKSNHNYGYFADLSQPNWTGRTARQQSIGGEYARHHSAAKRIPTSAYFVAAAAVLVLVLANFL